MNSLSYKCPKCTGVNFKRWELPHLLVLHWVLNPGLAFNEIVLGQRLPKTQLICQDCDGPILDRAFVPCPSCKTLHLGRLAAGKRSFRNWRGISCPSCNERIPCIWNVFSLLILGLTFPLWALPYFLYFRNLPLRPFFQLEDGKPPIPKSISKRTWIIMGASWGGFMWLIMSVIPALRSSNLGFDWNSALIGLPIWTVGGFAFGFITWFILGRTRK